MRQRDRILELMSELGRTRQQLGRHVRGDMGEYADMHADSIISEELTGAIDGSNRVYTSSHVPIETHFKAMLWLRGGLGYRSREYTQAGKMWVLSEALQSIGSGGNFDDQPCHVLYRFDPRAAEPDYDPATMGPFGRRRRYPEAPRRRRLPAVLPTPI